MSALVIGIDPGPKHNGWALLDFTVPSAPMWFDGGVTADAIDVLERFSIGPYHARLVVVEQARALHNPMANVQAMATAWAGGRIAGHAQRLGFHVLPLGVQQWRSSFVGAFAKGADTARTVDERVEIAIRSVVRSFPARSNVHQRDATGLACVGARMWGARLFDVASAKAVH